jgi:hypothetical protein
MQDAALRAGAGTAVTGYTWGHAELTYSGAKHKFALRYRRALSGLI